MNEYYFNVRVLALCEKVSGEYKRLPYWRVRR